MEDFEPPIRRPVIWLGNSKKMLLEFPKEVRRSVGTELQLMQFGGMPKDAKPFIGVGSGIFEVALRYNTDAYRVVLAVQLGDVIYILHVFQKKSTKGIATQKKDVDLIKKRYGEALRMSKR